MHSVLSQYFGKMAMRKLLNKKFQDYGFIKTCYAILFTVIVGAFLTFA